MKKLTYGLFCALLICSTILPHTTPEIFHEIRQGDKDAIKKRLEGWQDCSQTDEDGNNALHVAVAEGGKTEMVEMLHHGVRYIRVELLVFMDSKYCKITG